MKLLLKLEDFSKFLAIYLVWLYLGYSWWVFFLVLLLPDLSMLGYLGDARTGAILYNLFHHYATGIVCSFGGFILDNQILLMSGLILIAHTAMDRVFGYGLKYQKGFKYTHLGELGAGKTKAVD